MRRSSRCRTKRTMSGFFCCRPGPHAEQNIAAICLGKPAETCRRGTQGRPWLLTIDTAGKSLAARHRHWLLGEEFSYPARPGNMPTMKEVSRPGRWNEKPPDLRR